MCNFSGEQESRAAARKPRDAAAALIGLKFAMHSLEV